MCRPEHMVCQLIIGRSHAQGCKRRVSSPGKISLTHLTSGWMRLTRISRLRPLNLAAQLISQTPALYTRVNRDAVKKPRVSVWPAC